MNSKLCYGPASNVDAGQGAVREGVVSVIIGVPKEVKTLENRVGLTEASVAGLVAAGHAVLVESRAGEGSLISDADYEAAGATLVESAAEVYERAEIIVKVKEPMGDEYGLMREGQILYCYLHLANEPELAQMLCERKIKAVGYETIQLANGSLPLLVPMSEVAGRMASQIGATYLQKDKGGKGVLLGGVTGVHRGKVSILGAGVVGLNAAKMAIGLGAQVDVLDVNHQRLEHFDDVFGSRVTVLHSNLHNIEQSVTSSDLVIGAVLIPGARAPMLVSRQMVSQMQKGSVIVDVAVDQGGCVETSRPTTHSSPTFIVDDVVHYCVPNMPGVVPRTSTYALNNATLRYLSLIAARGLEGAVASNAALAKGLNTYDGYVVYEPVARDLGREYRPYRASL